MSTFEPNARVELHGLNATQYNLKLGVVIEGPNPVTGRIKVLLDCEIGLDHHLNLKPINLRSSNAATLPMGQSGGFDLILSHIDVIKDDFDRAKGPLLMLWEWMKHGGDPVESRRFMKEHLEGCSRANLNAGAKKLLNSIPHLFFRANSPIQLPPRPKKKIFQTQGEASQAAFKLFQIPIPRAAGSMFCSTTAGPFTIMHRSNASALTTLEVQARHNMPASIDFHPFSVSETAAANNDASRAKYSVSHMCVPSPGFVFSMKHMVRQGGKKKSEKAFYFDVFCAVCKVGGSADGCLKSASESMYVRGVHGMVLSSLYSVAKGVAYDKPAKRLRKFETALASGVDNLLSLKLATSGEQWRDLILPRDEPEAALAQSIELVNFHILNFDLGELAEARGDYEEAIRRYEVATTTIENAIKPGAPLCEYQKKMPQKEDEMLRVLYRTAGKEGRAISMCAWGLALKRAGRLREALLVYKRGLRINPHNKVLQTNMQRCRNAAAQGYVSKPAKGELQAEYSQRSSLEIQSLCVLEGCEKMGNPGDFKKCSACQAVMYCSKDHQKLDWANHKKFCKEKRKVGAASK